MDDALLAAAVRYAPVIYHHPDESNRPTNVDWLLARTALCFVDHTGLMAQTERVVERPSQSDLVAQRHPTARDSAGAPVTSFGTRSGRKRLTYYLEDVGAADAGGSADLSEWTTYLHTYQNDIGGTTLQYWRLYAFNTGLRVGAGLIDPAAGAALALEGGFHGGDWEGIHVELGTDGTPRRVRCLRHRDILDRAWSEVELEDGTHPRIYAGLGGHSSDITGVAGGARQQTWGGNRGAVVAWPDGSATPAGPLIDVGSKLEPANGQLFVQYSGLWGSPSRFPLAGSDLYYASSGYWGPAYNETELGGDGYVRAWGAGAFNPQQAANGVREYYAAATAP